MKKRVIMTICILVMVLLAGCSRKDTGPGREMDRMQRQERDGFGENTNTRLDFADCEFQIPSYFLYEKGISTERNRFFYAEHDVSLSMLHLAYVAKDWTKEEYLALKDEIAESSVQGVTSTEVVSVRDVLIAGRDGKNIVMDGVIDDFNVRINQYFFLLKPMRLVTYKGKRMAKPFRSLLMLRPPSFRNSSINLLLLCWSCGNRQCR